MEQGLSGRPYTFLFDDLKENSRLLKEANSKPITIFDDIKPRLLPFLHQSSQTYALGRGVWALHTKTETGASRVATTGTSTAPSKASPTTRCTSSRRSATPAGSSAGRHRSPAPAHYYHHGYHNVPGYAVAEGRPVRESRLPCCGIGVGWFLFILGFFLGAIPWYIGLLLLVCGRIDYREKPGYIASTIAAILATIAIVLGVTREADDC
ncbi:uncharacterized protein LOC108957040 [Eucalyptus grandis]|uniref:uncharacterized protein LOC108957040 n=1 Tax=Eucalyptus grandis TaxID=71139 RepID=UPI00192E918B|nr:uncharacterized protein LOC108957040 [Eucalyptus grandis]